MSATDRTVAFIDGLEVDVLKGETILDAATRIGIEIPTLCHAPHLVPEGGCRLCMVEIAGQRTQAACHTPLAPGMNIRSANEHLDQLRRGVLGLTVASAPGPFRPSPAGTKFERLLARYNVAGKEGPAQPRPVDASHPYMRFDRDRCITCRLCLNACEQVQGQFVYSIAGRGGRTSLIYGPRDQFALSDCVSCGACIDVCPTGAVTDRDRLGAEVADRAVESVCGYCGVGCRVHVESKDNVVLRIKGVAHAAVNDGHLCVKGRFAHAYHQSPQRLTTPLLRDASGTLQPATWPEAISFTARRLVEIRDRNGPNALGTMTSSRSTNEAAYLLQKHFRIVIGTNNVDCCARVCHSSTAVALGVVTGTGAATASFIDIDRAKVIVIAGANPTEAHPVVGAKLKQAVLRGAKLVVIDPREVELARYAGVHLQIWPGSNVATFNALTKVIIEEGLYDDSYVRDRCEGFEDLRTFVGKTPLGVFAAEARVSEADLRTAARLIASGPALFVSGLGLSEQTQGVASVMTYCNLGLLTGSLGRPGAGMLPLRGQNNVQGNADMGSQPYALTGYFKVDDEVARTHLASVWGTAPPREVGKTIPEMYDAACDGSLKALWIQGEDVAQSDPNHDHVMKAIGSLELLVVQELFMTQTAAMAHVVFPAAAVLEQEGTFTNGERRVQHVRPAVNAPGQAKPDWEVIRDVAALMAGQDAKRWQYEHPSKIFEELGMAVPHLFGGITYDRLLDDGVQWPCPDRSHPGTSSMHTTSFARSGGRALLTCVEYSPPRDAPDEHFPMLLITGRVLDHYNVGTMTRRTPSSQLVDRDYLEVHPSDAGRLGIADGGMVHVHSRWGRALAMAKHSARMQVGTAFMTFHFPETNTNCVVGPIVDPTSKCPDYKVVAVRLSPAGA